ncbi:MAG: alpha/beta hydrolase [Planktomarina sp.]|nr:alpha/beta hydrolase [Planktomarina sp.]
MPITPDGTNFELTGPADAPVVVLIHGLGLNKECWQWTTPALVGAYRVLSYDIYGHGESLRPPETPDLSLFSNQLNRLLDHCGVERATITGFSLGGMIARRFAQDVPQRASALIILHSPHKRSEKAQKAILKRVDQARELGPQSTVEAALERWFTEKFRVKNPDLMDTVRRWVYANQKSIYHKIYRVLATGIDEIVAPTPAIACPTLVITGNEDYGNGPEMAHSIAAEILGAKTLILSNLRHMALAEKPEAVNRPIRQFLDKVNTLA